MRKFVIYILSGLLCLPTACISSSKYTAKVVKPKYHHWRYERKNDKRVKRTKVVKVKS